MPDINIDDPRPAGEDPLQQRDWVDQGIQNARSNPVELPQGLLPATQAYLQQESNAVAFREEVILLEGDLNYIRYGDTSYGARICAAIDSVVSAFSSLDNLNQVVDYLHGLASSYGQPSNDLAYVIWDATAQFQRAFGSCIEDLRPTQWILEVIQELFCSHQG